MLASVVLGLALGWLLQGLGNHGLWLALLCFMLLRGLSLAILAWHLQRQDAWLALQH
ncbi:DNA-damage-inducible SOS response protein [compost metagenome]